jgi:molybdopterin molybdotransferase
VRELARLKGFKRLTNVDEALSILLKTLKPKRLGSISISVSEALGRVTAENLIAPIDLPSFDRSAVDGYALRARDTFEASQFKSKAIQLTSADSVREGQAKQVWTGNPMPNGADAVIMLEHTKAVKNGIEVLMALTPGENVSKRGEDMRKGDFAVESGTCLQAHHIGLVAALGISEVEVVEKPKIAILSTGNELVELGRKPHPNQIIDSNQYIISGLVAELGAEPMSLGIAKDDEHEIGTKISTGLAKADIVITTGGTSVGASDLVALVVNKLGKPGVIVHGVALRPGMPTALAVLEGKPVFVLSGYPVAATVGFEVFARPIMLKLLGIEHDPRPLLKAKLTRRVSGALGRRVYLRVNVFREDDDFLVEPVHAKGSGLLSSITKANGYVIIPENREGLDQGEMVMVQLFSHIRGAKCV